MSQVIAVTGPAGAGKTTVSQAYAKSMQKCAHIDVDYIKHFVVTGFIYDTTDEGIAQWKTLGKNVGFTAKNLLEDGFDVVINGYLHKKSWDIIEEYVNLDLKVLLFPDQDSNLARNKGRRQAIALSDNKVMLHREYFSTTTDMDGFVKIDNGKLSIDATVDKIKHLLYGAEL